MTALHTNFTIKHLATGYESTAPVQVSLYEQNTKPNFASTQVYARMDPIFTYQNTVRTFSVTCETLTLAEYGKFKGYKNFKNVTELANLYSGFIQDIYKFMYPLYEQQVEGAGIVTQVLKGPPLLELKIDNILTDGSGTSLGAQGGIIFVPDQFSLTRGLADSTKINFTVGEGDLRYIANAGGYGFTLAGTILHRKEPPGFISKRDETTGATTISFSKKRFPIGSDRSGVPEILKGENSE